MTCKELQDLLVDHRAKELPPLVRLSLNFHAAMCSCCRALVKTYGLTVELSADLAQAKVPDEVASSVEAMLRDLAAGKLQGS